MIGAIIGVRESAHFDCDVWPDVSPRVDAFGRLLGRLGVLVTALIFIWAGIEFTRFAWKRTSELGDLPLVDPRRVAGRRGLMGHLSR
jgi:TRAP-type C4-dicarboxylate transport system permease small subunit